MPLPDSVEDMEPASLAMEDEDFQHCLKVMQEMQDEDSPRRKDPKPFGDTRTKALLFLQCQRRRAKEEV